MGRLGGGMSVGQTGKDALDVGKGAAGLAKGNVKGAVKAIPKAVRLVSRGFRIIVILGICLLFMGLNFLLAGSHQLDYKQCEAQNGLVLGDGAYTPLTEEQRRRGDMNYSVAAIALTVANQMKVSDKVLLALFETAIVESGFKNYANDGNWTQSSDGSGSGISVGHAAATRPSMNLPHDAVGTDHASMGYLQQQMGYAPDHFGGWGTIEQLMNPAYATKAFLDKAIPADKGAGQTAGQLAQSVQRSAFPERYDRQEGKAREILQTLRLGSHYAPLVGEGAVQIDATSSCLGGFVPGAKITMNNYGCDPDGPANAPWAPKVETRSRYNPGPYPPGPTVAMPAGTTGGSATCVENNGPDGMTKFTFYLPQSGPTLTAITHALQHVNHHTPYAWAGGDDAGNPSMGDCSKYDDVFCYGLDCGGLTYSAYVASGVPFGGRLYSDGQLNWMKNMGARDVTYADKEPGDLMWWTSPGATTTHHVAMYLGHAITMENGVEKEGADIIVAESGRGDYAKIQYMWTGGDNITWMRFWGTAAVEKSGAVPKVGAAV